MAIVLHRTYPIQISILILNCYNCTNKRPKELNYIQNFNELIYFSEIETNMKNFVMVI